MGPLKSWGKCASDINPSGCGSAWLERLVWDQEVAGSNPVTPILCGCSSMVEHQPSKLDTWVRFPSPALNLQSTFACLQIWAHKKWAAVIWSQQSGSIHPASMCVRSSVG